MARFSFATLFTFALLATSVLATGDSSEESYEDHHSHHHYPHRFVHHHHHHHHHGPKEDVPVIDVRKTSLDDTVQPAVDATQKGRNTDELVDESTRRGVTSDDVVQPAVVDVTQKATNTNELIDESTAKGITNDPALVVEEVTQKVVESDFEHHTADDSHKDHHRFHKYQQHHV